MTGGETTFLQGLSDISSGILKDMAGIYQLRTQTALENAKAKIGLAEGDFKYKIQNGDINPTNFDDEFNKYRSGLEDFANSSEYEPAQDAIRAFGESTLPQLKAQSYVEILKSESVKSMYSTFDTIDTIRNTQGKTADEVKNESLNALNGLFASRGVNQEVYLQKKAETEEYYKTGKILETVKAHEEKWGFENTYNSLFSTEGPLKDARIKDKINIQKQYSDKAKENGVKFLENLNSVLPEMGFVSKEYIDDKTNKAGILPTDKNIAEAATIKHNVDFLYDFFLKEIDSNTNNEGVLRGILSDLEVEGNLKRKDSTGKEIDYSEYEVWGNYQEKKEELVNKVRVLLKSIDDGKTSKTTKLETDALNTAMSEMDVARLNYKEGSGDSYAQFKVTLNQIIRKTRDQYPSNTPLLTTKATALLNGLQGDVVNSQAFKDASGAVEKIISTVSNKDEKQTKAFNDKDYYINQELYRFFSGDTKPTDDDVTAKIKSLTDPFVLKNIGGYTRFNRETEGIGDKGKTIELIKDLQKGMADPIINLVGGKVAFVPGYEGMENTYAAAAGLADEDYGVSGTVAVPTGKGDFVLRKDNGDTYRFVENQNGKLELYILDKNGIVGEKIDVTKNKTPPVYQDIKTEKDPLSPERITEKPKPTNDIKRKEPVEFDPNKDPLGVSPYKKDIVNNNTTPPQKSSSDADYMEYIKQTISTFKSDSERKEWFISLLAGKNSKEIAIIREKIAKAGYDASTGKSK
jgi:hypothetical protein